MWSGAALALLLLLASDPVAEGMKALEEQRWDAAVKSFEEVVAAAPDDYSAHFHLALALTMAKQDERAIAEYRRTLELKPGLPEAGLNLGILLFRVGRAADALPHLESAAKTKPEVRAHLALADALLATGDAPRAEAEAAKAVAADPKSAAAELTLARAILKQRGSADAAAHYARAAELDPAFAEARLELAEQYEREKKPAEAAAIYAQFPANAAARERAGELLLESGKAAEALPHLEEAVRTSPTPANLYALANAYILAKQVDRALPLFEKALASDGANTDLRLHYARALREQRRFGPAAAEFAKAAVARPKSAEIWSDLAAMRVLLEEYPAALEALDRVRALNAEKPGHHFLRAIVLDRQRQFRPALESYEKFLSLSAGSFPDEEWKARQRIKVLQREIEKR